MVTQQKIEDFLMDYIRFRINYNSKVKEVEGYGGGNRGRTCDRPVSV
jgi:hypothetical protein